VSRVAPTDAPGAGIPPAPVAGAALSDVATVGLAAVVWVGARIAAPVPLAIGLGMVVVAVAARRPALLLIAGLVLGSATGARAWTGLRPASARPFAGTVTLLSDPAARFGATTADVRVGHRRVELSAWGAAQGSLSRLLAGERVAVVGRIEPPPAHAPWMVPRHLVGRLVATRVELVDQGAVPWRAANGLRRTLAAGAAVMPPDARSLFMGFVLGDDRDQTVSLTDDFRGSGLTHLLVVSGENVAFVLALVMPVLRRLGMVARWAATLAVLLSFCLVTRFEPSVLRAGVMAGLAATAFALGRPSSGLRLLALAVAGLVLVDPLLTRSIGFALSVAASAGILVLAPRFRRAIPGPAVVVDPLAITLAAQLAVAPLLIATFGGIPTASVPANLLAAPAAGLVMTWGLGAGIPAGLLGPGAARVLHAPTMVGTWWIAAVARILASAPLGRLGLGSVATMGGALCLVVVGHRGRRPVVRAAGLLALAAVLLLPAIELRGPAPESVPVAGGTLWRAGGATVLVVGSVADPAGMLDDLRRLGVRRIDLVVATGGPRSTPAIVAAVAHRWRPGLVWVGPGVAVVGATVPPPGRRVRIGGLVVAVERVRPTMVVGVGTPPSAGAARGPPG